MPPLPEIVVNNPLIRPWGGWHWRGTLRFHFTGFAGIRALCNQYNILMICDEALATLFKLAVKTVEFVVVLFSKHLEVSLYTILHIGGWSNGVHMEFIGCKLQLLIIIYQIGLPGISSG